MEWIETTGRTIEEAKEAALDQLGVDEQDAEFEVLAEPKVGLFGRMRVEARVRSRVRPTAPRPKEDRRDRRRRRGGAGGEAPADATTAGSAAAGGASGAATTTAEVVGSQADRDGDEAPVAATATATLDRPAADQPTRSGGGRRRRPRTDDTDRTETTDVSAADVPLEQQAEVATAFLDGLVERFGLTASIATSIDHEEEVVDVAVTGEGLGLLIGPKGATLLAIQDLTRTAVQQETGAGTGRLNVDVAGYRQKRTEALARFARQVAEEVRQSGSRRALEPMSAIDRKVIHDTVAEVEGVSSTSEGEDAARRVVIQPA